MIKIGEGRSFSFKIHENYLMDSDILKYGNRWNNVVNRVEDLIINSTAFNDFLTYCAHCAINQLAKEGLIKYNLDADTFLVIEEEETEK